MERSGSFGDFRGQRDSTRGHHARDSLRRCRLEAHKQRMGLEKKNWAGRRKRDRERISHVSRDNCVRGELNYVQFTREGKQVALAEIGSI